MSHVCFHGATLFLREISAIEVKSIHFKHMFYELEKGRCRYRLVTAFMEEMFSGFQGTIMQDRSI